MSRRDLRVSFILAAIVAAYAVAVAVPALAGYGTTTVAHHAASHGNGGGDAVTLAEGQVSNLLTDLGNRPTGHPGWLRFGSGACAASAKYLQAGGGAADTCATSSDPTTKWVAPYAVTVKAVDCVVTTAAGSTHATTCTVYVNGSSTSVAAALSDPAVEGRDTSHTAAVSAGQAVEVKETTTGTAPGALTATVYLQ